MELVSAGEGIRALVETNKKKEKEEDNAKGNINVEHLSYTMKETENGVKKHGFEVTVSWYRNQPYHLLCGPEQITLTFRVHLSSNLLKLIAVSSLEGYHEDIIKHHKQLAQCLAHGL